MRQAVWTTDGTPAMRGERKGMASMACAKVQERGGESVKMQCIHQEALYAKTVHLGDVMSTVVKTVNIIRARGLFFFTFKLIPDLSLTSTNLLVLVFWGLYHDSLVVCMPTTQPEYLIMTLLLLLALHSLKNVLYGNIIQIILHCQQRRITVAV